MRVASSLLAVLVIALGACSQNAANIRQRALNRPSQVELACANSTTFEVLPLSACQRNSLGELPAERTLYVLTTQTTRGEVSVIDLRNQTVIDLDRRVPGATFRGVSQVPSDIVVPAQRPECTFVISRGEDSLYVVNTRSFFDRNTPEDSRLVPLPDVPESMVASPSGDALYLSFPTLSAVGKLPILSASCELGVAQLFTVPDGLGDVRTSAVPSSFRSCPSSVLPGPLTTEPPASSSTTDAPAPGFLAWAGDELWIGDLAQPYIHRLVAETFAAPIPTGAPIRQFVVTPEVPLDFGSTVGAKYAYAIDDRDGSILALDVTEGANFGTLIPLRAPGAQRPYRIPFSAPATGLSMIASEYEGLSSLSCLAATRDPVPAAAVLRGVFVGVTFGDGALRFVDVYDLDHECRGGAQCAAPVSQADVVNVFHRHRPRPQSLGSTLVSLYEQPLVQLNQSVFRIDAGGQGPDGLPSLGAISCPTGLTDLFVDTQGVTRFCGIADPTTAPNEVWNAAWQGVLLSGLGVAVAGPNQFALSVDPCAYGALGSANVAAIAAADETAREGQWPGDVLALRYTGTSTSLSAECRALFGFGTSDTEDDWVLLPIAEALGSSDASGFPGRVEVSGANAPEVAACVGTGRGYVFEVRSGGTYVISSATAGREHRITRSAGPGLVSCSLDASMGAERVGRAVPEQVFANGRVSFVLTGAPPIIGRFAISVRTTGGADAFARDLGLSGNVRTRVVATDIEWNSIAGRLFVIDADGRGLIEYDVTPVTVTGNYQ